MVENIYNIRSGEITNRTVGKSKLKLSNDCKEISELVSVFTLCMQVFRYIILRL